MERGLLAIRLLQIKFNSIKSLRKLTKNNINFVDWKEQTIELLEKILGNDDLVEKFKTIKYCVSKHPYHTDVLDLDIIQTCFQKGLDQAEDILKEAMLKYSSNYVSNTVTNLNKYDFEAVVEDLYLPDAEKQKLMLDIERIFEQENINNEDNELENNNIVSIYNRITPKAMLL